MPHPDQALIRQRAEEVIRSQPATRFLQVIEYGVGHVMSELAGMTTEESTAYFDAIAEACNNTQITITWTDTEGEPT